MKFERKMKMEKLIEFTPAFDKRNPNPNKNYGIHGMELRFILKGNKGATQFLIYTNWYLPHVLHELSQKAAQEFDSSYIELLFSPMAVDIGYHSKMQVYENQLLISKDCPYTNGDCYYDGSGLRAEEFLPKFLEKGTNAVWEMLEEYYVNKFGKEENENDN